MEASFVMSRPFAMYRGKGVPVCRGRYTRKLGGAAHAVLCNTAVAPCGAVSGVWCSVGGSRRARVCPTCEAAVQFATQDRAALVNG